jgi:predicted dehydrogenase
MSENKDLTRRDVVRTASAVTAAVVGAAAASSQAPAVVKAQGPKTKYGMIGTGSRGSYLLKHLKGIDSGECVAICDTKDEALKRGSETIGNNPKQYKDYRELLADKNVEAVLIATPLYMHYPITKDALQAGKHVFCEKCLVFTAREVYELRDLANSLPKQILQTGLQRRYSQFYQEVKKWIDDDKLGLVTHVNAQWHRNGTGTLWKDDPNNWRIKWATSAGLAGELASHQLDVADWMFGAEPEYVIGVGGLDTFKGGEWEVYDNISLIFVYPGGRKLTYTSISTNSHLPAFGGKRTQMAEVIMGSRGAVEITVGDDNNPVIARFYPDTPGNGVPGSMKESGEKKEWKAGASMVAAAGGGGTPMLLDHHKVKDTDSFLTREQKYGKLWLFGKGVMNPEELRNPVDTELDEYFKSCQTGKRPLADLEVGLHDSIGVIMANAAMRENRKVMFNELESMARAQGYKGPGGPIGHHKG